MSSHESSHRAVQWTPRIICIAFALLLSMFAFDVFEEPVSPIRKVGALLVHLIPTFGVLLILWVTWKRPWVGAIVFPLLGIFYVVWSWGKFNWMAPTFIGGPLLVMGILFWMSWRARATSTR
ncbi:MAG TPA: hypothetical protein VFH88_05465 [Candidatus Krumholzibacteria bacterium]|nr:hypothetical protein [Candidatus Krumholzibacteria bacterium]